MTLPDDVDPNKNITLERREIPTGQVLSITKLQKICCPNCGSPNAKRYYLENCDRISSCYPRCHIIQTQCSHCDYLMIMCCDDGHVIEAEGEGIPVLSH